MPTAVKLTLTLRRIVQVKNPREYFDSDEMADLEAGLRPAGRVIQPASVRSIPGRPVRDRHRRALQTAS
ncbi:hypothetical protein [Hydrogenophaga sp. BPS33]|uniref:hypothetical protein n=1 Tax=Hydrogenophaga sp. BPS33 TaxID=2651974 RepID=UPI001916D0B8|nr:hypothetical protein [Hydrogenophaga sp. BPS33]